MAGHSPHPPASHHHYHHERGESALYASSRGTGTNGGGHRHRHERGASVTVAPSGEGAAARAVTLTKSLSVGHRNGAARGGAGDEAVERALKSRRKGRARYASPDWKLDERQKQIMRARHRGSDESDADAEPPAAAAAAAAGGGGVRRLDDLLAEGGAGGRGAAAPSENGSVRVISVGGDRDAGGDDFLSRVISVHQSLGESAAPSGHEGRGPGGLADPALAGRFSGPFGSVNLSEVGSPASSLTGSHPRPRGAARGPPLVGPETFHEADSSDGSP